MMIIIIVKWTWDIKFHMVIVKSWTHSSLLGSFSLPEMTEVG